MNKVSERCGRENCAKFLFASKKMFAEVKAIKVLLYILAIIPIALQFIPALNKNEKLSFLYTVISFSITITTEFFSTFLNNHKEKAILLNQLYEAEITGSTFSKIEYDREMTNELNELAIRKGLVKMRKAKSLPVSFVPEGISDDYSLLFLSRKNAANTNFLLGRMFVLYTLQLIAIIGLFVFAMFYKTNTSEYLQLIICFYPLVIPIIRDCFSCKKTQRNCVKICADIDNFFADGDGSVERLARFYYYVQNIEFEMYVNRPTIYKIFSRTFRKGMKVLTDGVTVRFMEAINELRINSEGLLGKNEKKNIITKVDYDIVELERKKKEREARKAAAEKRALVQKRAYEEQQRILEEERLEKEKQEKERIKMEKNNKRAKAVNSKKASRASRASASKKTKTTKR